MSGGMLGGVVGAVAGFMIGGPSGAMYGWTIGSAAGNLLFPTKNEIPPSFGPRLTDLRVQVSTEGTSIPRVFGTMRLAGNIIWSTALQENASTVVVQQQGGKGGGGAEQAQTSYYYTVDFAVALCEGPIVGIRKIWCNGTLLYNVSETAATETVMASGTTLAQGITVYPGTDDQAVDSLIESVEGAGNVSAFRDTALVVFRQFNITDRQVASLSQLNFEFEVVRNGTELGLLPGEFINTPQDVGVGNTSTQLQTSNGYLWGVSPAADNYDEIWCYNLYTKQKILSFPRLLSQERAIPFATDTAGNLWAWRYNNGSPDTGLFRFSLTGQVSLITVANRGFIAGGMMDATGRLVYIPTGGNAVNVVEVDLDAGTGTLSVVSVPYVTNVNQAGNAMGIPGRFYCWSASNTGTRGWGYVDLTTLTFVHLFTAVGVTQPSISVGNDGFIYAGLSNGVTGSTGIDKFTSEGALVDSLSISGMTALYANGIQQDILGYLWVELMKTSVNYIYKLDPADMSEVSNGALTGLITGPQMLFPNIAFPGSGGLLLWESSDTNDLKIFAMEPVARLTSAPVGLDEVVTELFGLVDILPAELDVSDLSTVDVYGYTIASRGTVRGMIEPLMAAYFFDVVESDYKVKFVRRAGKTSQLTVPQACLAAHYDSLSQDDSPIKLMRDQNLELPLEINVSFADRNNNYQLSTVSSRRTAESSQGAMTIELALALTPDEASAIANTLLYMTWQNRTKVSFTADRSFMAFEPTDILTLVKDDGTELVVRITSKGEDPMGVISFDGELEYPALYTQTVPGAAGAPGNEDVDFVGVTVPVFMDIPLLRVSDNDPGFYWNGFGTGVSFSGSQLFQSIDGGAVFTALANGTMLAEGTIGAANMALGNVGLSIEANEFIDEVNTVTVVMNNGELTSVTRDQLLVGANAALLGDEVLQFRDATLVAANTYELSGLLRGRLGTEAAMLIHFSGDRFVLLDSTSRTIYQDFNRLNEALIYKPVTIGSTLQQSAAYPFTNTGVRRRPLAPWRLAVGRSAAGDILIQWVRRTRDPSITWNTPEDPPIFESAERYAVDIMSGAAVLRTITVTAQEATYTAAEQTTDWGGLKNPCDLRVSQISPEYGRGFYTSGSF